MSSRADVQRTPREAFAHEYGESLAQGYDHPRPPYREPEPEPDDISELYYKVRENMRACGMGEGEVRDFLARLRDAEETLDEAEGWAAVSDPPQSYDEMLNEYERQLGLWEGNW